MQKGIHPVLLIAFGMCIALVSLQGQEVEETDVQEAMVDQRDSRLDTLRYGIDADVLELIGSLNNDGITHYDTVLLDIFAETRNSNIKVAIYTLWQQNKFPDGLARAREDLQSAVDDEDISTPIIRSAIAYLSSQSDIEAAPLLYELSESRDTALAASAVRAIGSIGDSNGAETLLDRLITEDPVASEDLVAAIIVTLGQLRFEPATDELILIAEDEGASSGHRRFACMALGQIGREDAFPIVERLYFESDDAILRSYALAGLAEFPDQDVEEILIQALKRDSFWRIRVTAAEQLGELALFDTEDLLIYKVQNDPVTQVKAAALTALGKLNTVSSAEFLCSFFENDENPMETRLVALGVMADQQVPGGVESIGNVMDTLWEEDDRRFLEFTCRDLSRKDWMELGPLYLRMLAHPNWLLKVYGIRGIRRNTLTELYGSIEAINTENLDGRVKREIEAGRLEEE